MSRIVDIAPLLDDLKKELDEECDHPTAVCSDEAVADEIDMLEALPVIDPATLRPVGYWEVGGVDPVSGVVGNWTCSLCDETSPEDSPFCPNCGAKMEG